MATSPHILVVEHNPYNLELLKSLLSQKGYQVVGATTLEDTDQILDSKVIIQLALVDIEGFDRNIWARCEALHERGTPLLVIAPGANESYRQESYQQGVYRVLVKPLVTTELITVICGLLGGKA